MDKKPKYKRSHSAMNANVVIPAFSISSGKVVTTGGDGQLSSDPLELIRSFGVVGEVSSSLTTLDDHHIFPFTMLSSVLSSLLLHLAWPTAILMPVLTQTPSHRCSYTMQMQRQEPMEWKMPR